MARPAGISMKMACECADRSCTGHRGSPSCGALGLLIMRRVDHADGAGTLLCADCRDFALEPGRYSAGRLGARSTRPLSLR